MNTHQLALTLVVAASALSGCGADTGGSGSVAEAAGAGTGGAPAGSGGGGSSASPVSASGCNLDYGRFAADGAPPPSFRADILPILGLSCTAAECHDDADRKAGLFLGARCKYDATARWKCAFPASPDPDPTRPQPLTDDVVRGVHDSLLAASATAAGVTRAEPGAPDKSFLLDKLADTENDRGYVCRNQDTGRSTLPCGGYMPITGSRFCASASGQEKFDAIARWIAAGAPLD